MHIIRVDNHAVGFVTVLLPNRPIIKTHQTIEARLHIVEAAQPDVVIRLAEQPELAEDVHVYGSLGRNEVGFKIADKMFTHIRLQRVVADFEYIERHLTPSLTLPRKRGRE